MVGNHKSGNKTTALPTFYLVPTLSHHQLRENISESHMIRAEKKRDTFAFFLFLEKNNVSMYLYQRPYFNLVVYL